MMKTLMTAWIVALLLYLVTPMVLAKEAMEQQLWQGRGVVGEVCLDVNQTEFNTANEVLVWVVSDGETVDWQLTEEMACVPVKFSEKSAIYARHNAQQTVQVVEDNTTPFISIELPF